MASVMTLRPNPNDTDYFVLPSDNISAGKPAAGIRWLSEKAFPDTGAFFQN